ncbi:hypothetical protein [Massilia endophytica]|uniref:hypothetical protein n=1 Tax=Massilia endophytica TaxID=2899220 RepID=UPI001E54600F|nr:hypothetical protein [Massilia endophytica]UGQ44943.1 hypothetical protein LSQ66_14165 [Massilia endophytica]
MPNFHGRIVSGEKYDELREQQEDAYQAEFDRLVEAEREEWIENFGSLEGFKPRLAAIHEAAVRATEPEYTD